MLSAGPGWGKTTAVASWLAARRRPALPVAWLTAPTDVNDPASFRDHLLAALRSAVPVPECHPLTPLSASAGVPEEVLASVVAALADLPEEILLVLDDSQTLTDPAVLRSPARLVAR